MLELISDFLEIPIGIRFTMFLCVVLVLYWIFGRLIFKLLSLIPYVIKLLVYAIYFLIEIPVSALHRAFGSAFAKLDQGLAACSGKLTDFMGRWYSALHTPKKIHGGKAFLIFLALAAYLILPPLVDFNEGIFTFWQTSYLEREAKVIDFIKNRL